MTAPDLIALFDIVHGAEARDDTGRFGAAITQPGFRKGVKPPNAGRKFPAEPLTPDETMRVLDACGGGKTGIRNRAILVVLWRAGLRVSECLALKPHHIDFEQHHVVVLNGKGSRRRTSGIDDWALEQVQDWYAIRARLGVAVDAPLFCCVSKGSVGNPVNPAFVRALCKRLQRDTGISKRVHPHGMRHAHACDLVREGTPVHFIQRQLGHSNLGMTANYLAGIAPEEMVAAIAARPQPGEAPVVAVAAERPRLAGYPGYPR